MYQIKVVEDGRTRYRLRLGPFTREAEADAALATVRDDYPGALTATAGAADLQIFHSLTAMPPPAAAVPPPENVPAPEVEIPTLELEPVQASAAPPAPQQRPAAPQKPPPTPQAPPPAPVLQDLTGHSGSRSFVIQLLLADELPDPDAVPNLDIFSVYQLYAVSGRDRDRVRHALRLGFFADEAAATTVASYLSEFYERPTIVRISSAEKNRFAERRVEARKDVGATGRHTAIEITGDLLARYPRSASNA